MGQKLLGYQLKRIKELASYGQGTFSPHAVNQLLGHINELEDDITIRNKAISEMQHQIDRLIENVSQLNSEKHELEEKLEAADELVSFNSYEEKKVVLPSLEAEALDYLGHRHSRYQILELYFTGDIRTKKLDYDDKRNAALSTIRDCEFEDVLLALANGYTVEEPPTTEERLEATLESFLNSFDVQSPIPTRELAAKLTLTIRTVLAEDRQDETQ